MAPFSNPTDPRPPLPDWIKDAYEVIERAASGTPSELAYPEAIDQLEADAELDLERSDAEHAVERLLQRGYLYRVEEDLRITGPLEDPSVDLDED